MLRAASKRASRQIPRKRGCSDAALNQAQRVMVEKARALGAGGQGVALTEAACSYLVGVIVDDLGLERFFPELSNELPRFFGDDPVGCLEVADVPFPPLLERLVELAPDADSYFSCLAELHKSRLKYERILRTQPIPNIEQVGPRSLLEFGKLGPQALGAYSGQGRWAEELSFPEDCRASAYVPVLVVLDSTPNAKLDELREAFETAGGESFVGGAAWEHLDGMAGPVMAKFLERYVHKPLQAVMEAAPRLLPPLAIRMDSGDLIVDVGSESFRIARDHAQLASDARNLPEDVDEEAQGP